MTASRRLKPATATNPIPPPPQPPKQRRKVVVPAARGVKTGAARATKGWWVSGAHAGFYPHVEAAERIADWMRDADGRPARRPAGGVSRSTSGGGVFSGGPAPGGASGADAPRSRPMTQTTRAQRQQQKASERAARDAKKDWSKHEWRVRIRCALVALAALAVLAPGAYLRWWSLLAYVPAAYVEIWAVGRASIRREERAGLAAITAVAGQPEAPAALPRGSVSTVSANSIRSALLTAGIPNLGTSNIELVAFGRIEAAGPGRRAGKVVDVVLPPGVLASDARDPKRVERLASAFPDRPVECFTLGSIPGGGAGSLRIFIADEPWQKTDSVIQPALSAINVFDPVVVILLDGMRVPIRISLLETMILVGGLSGLGKSELMRCLVDQVVLDPEAELWVMAVKDSADWAPYESMCHRYLVTSDTGEAIARWESWVTALDAEMKFRQGVLRRTADARTRVDADVSRAGVGLHPLIVVCDEFGQLWPGAPDELIDRTAQLMTRCAGVGIVLINSLQDAVGQNSLPGSIARAHKMWVSFATVSTTATNAILGDGAHGAGLRASDLPKGDPGRVMAILPDGRQGEFRTPLVPPAHRTALLGCARDLRAAARTITGHGSGEDPDEADPAHSLLTLALAQIKPEVRGAYLDELAQALAGAHEHLAHLDRDALRTQLEEEGVPIEQPLRIAPFKRGAMGVYRASLVEAHRRQFGIARPA